MSEVKSEVKRVNFPKFEYDDRFALPVQDKEHDFIIDENDKIYYNFYICTKCNHRAWYSWIHKCFKSYKPNKTCKLNKKDQNETL